MWSELDSLVEASMQEWKVPGLALAVIQDGEIAVLKGYGARDTCGYRCALRLASHPVSGGPHRPSQ